MDVELFKNRNDAGQRLANRLLSYKDRGAIVIAITRGGVPVGAEIAERLGITMDVILPRKIPIPWTPEAGLGAVTPDGTVVLNERMVRNLGLDADEIGKSVEAVHREIVRRMIEYRGDKPMPDICGRPVILVNDGLASGYTMLAAIESLRKHSPASMTVAVPVASSGSARLVGPIADKFVSLIISERLPFTVASFYRDWRDLTGDEVRDYLDRAHESAPGEDLAA